MREEMIARELAEMIRIKTFSPRCEEDLVPFREMQKVMEKACPKVFSELEKYEINGNLLFKYPGTLGGNPVLLMGHQDVVPAGDEGWKHPPFDAVIDEGNMFGRGTIDCKSVIYAEFKAVEELLEEGFCPKYDIYLATAVDEEIGGTGAPSLVEELKRRNVRLELVLDEGGNIKMNPFPGERKRWGLMGIMEKGGSTVKIIARSNGGHAAMPPRDNPVVRLASFIHEVETVKPFETRLDPALEETIRRIAPYMTGELGEIANHLEEYKERLPEYYHLTKFLEPMIATTCAFTMMQGSDVANMIPTEASVTASLRTLRHQDCDPALEVLKKIGEKYDLEFEMTSKRDATVPVDIGSDTFHFVEKCIRDVFPDVEPVPYPIFGGTDCRHFIPIANNPIRFCPIYLDPTQTNHAHKADENISLRNVDAGIDFYKYLLKEWQKR